MMEFPRGLNLLVLEEDPTKGRLQGSIEFEEVPLTLFPTGGIDSLKLRRAGTIPAGFEFAAVRL